MKAGNGQVGKLFTPCFPLPGPAPTDHVCSRRGEARNGEGGGMWRGSETT